jgi:hypothetical protein
MAMSALSRRSTRPSSSPRPVASPLGAVAGAGWSMEDSDAITKIVRVNYCIRKECVISCCTCNEIGCATSLESPQLDKDYREQ